MSTKPFLPAAGRPSPTVGRDELMARVKNEPPKTRRINFALDEDKHLAFKIYAAKRRKHVKDLLIEYIDLVLAGEEAADAKRPAAKTHSITNT